MNNFIGTIPPSLGNISTLLSLSLMENHLEGNIPVELGYLSNLKFFQLASNKFSGTVPRGLYNISSMLHFSIADNQLHDQIPPHIGFTLPNLRFIYLGKNKFSGPIPASIVNSSGLVQLDMGMNALAGPVPQNLGSLQNLQALNFGSNPLGNSGDLSFLTSLTNCPSHSLLWFFQNNLRGVLPDSIGNLSTNLNSLQFDTNYISGSIPTGVGNLVGLEYLALFENMLIRSIPDSIGRLSKLKCFHAYTNRIRGEIPSSFGNMTRLILLNLADNLLEGPIPVSLGSCIDLEGLELSHNHLNGMIPKEVIGLSSFSIGLSLASNNLTGPLPPEVGNCKNLDTLDVSRNKLYGEIPSSLGFCLMLEQLSLEGNSFEGTVPSSLSKLRSMQVVDFSHNKLSGEIPEFLGELPLLMNLSLSFNNFEGRVPTNGVFGNISAFSVLQNKKLCGGIKPLQLPSCPTGIAKKGKNFPLSVIIATVCCSVIALLLTCLFATTCWMRSSRKKEGSASPSEKKYLNLSYAELHYATEGGRYGSVYRGILSSDGQTVAVKVFNLQQRRANKTFKAECEVLRNLRHRNLVKIITCCSSIDFQGNGFKALVLEFMPNGSLESWLHPDSSALHDSRNLNVVQRLNIAIDVASALDYLRSQFDKPVVHCDLKPSNILLDADLTAHLSDFGLARFVSATTSQSIDEQSSSIGIRGSVGYIPPEYGMGKEISTPGDVYSYGILLMELSTGKSPSGSSFTGDLNLHDHVKMALPDRLEEIVDPSLEFENQGVFNPTGQSSSSRGMSIWECLASLLSIGVKCSADLPRERMNMRDVLTQLHIVRNMLLGDQRRRERLRITNNQ